MTKLVQKSVSSRVGALRLVASDDALVGVYFAKHRHALTLDAVEVGAHPVLDLAARELDAYFAGARRAFSVPLGPTGTGFQREVWMALREIPFGATRTYGEVAKGVGRPKAVRAVGAANGRNPLSIVVPCHRVIASDGALAGYAGGEDIKRWLLDHERAISSATPEPEVRAAP